LLLAIIFSKIGLDKIQPDKRKRNKIIFVAVMLFGICVLLNCWTIIDWSSNYHVGSVVFNGKTYHLYEYYMFDSRTTLYLGECENFWYWCKFHEILEKPTPYTGDIHIFDLSKNENELLVLDKGEAIYKFDGEDEYCFEYYNLENSYEPGWYECSY
jgi:hypothetical protein